MRNKEQKNRKLLIISISIGIIVLVAALIISAIFLVNKNSGGPSNLTHGEKVITSVTPANVTEWGGISVGKDGKAGTKNENAEKVIDLYFDYGCSHCNELEDEFGDKIGELVKNGKATLILHPLTIMGTQYSYFGANAELFIAENAPEIYYDFHVNAHKKLTSPMWEEMIKKQREAKEKNEDFNGIQGPSLEDIVKVATDLGLSPDKAENMKTALQQASLAQVNGESQYVPGAYAKHLQEYVNQFVKDGNTGTPAVYVNGENVKSWSSDLEKKLS